jgi:CTP synthase (UTP-ammonia lyase)
MIGVVGDYDPRNETHLATSDALAALPEGTPFQWVPTDQTSTRMHDFTGFFIAPASPYRDMEGVLEVIRFARERGVPLVGT